MGFGDTLILMHQLDWDVFVLNGYCLIRISDVRNYRIFSRDCYWQCKAARQKSFRPIAPEISVATWRSAISGAAESFPLLCFETELRLPDKLWVGKPVAMTEKTLTVRGLDPYAEWCANSRFHFEDLTKVQFGGGYESALALSMK